MFTHARSRSLLFQADPAVIAAAVPARAVAGPGFSVAAKHTAAATLKLREMGYQAPSPICSYYDWPLYKGRHKPWEHQKLMAEFMVAHKRCFNLSEMGTAKTSATLWALDWMMNEGQVKKVLILAPLSTLEQVWHIGTTETITHRKSVILHGSLERRLKRLRDKSADIYILNHDGLSIRQLREAIQARRDITHIVVDEGSKFRNSKTDKYRALERILRLRHDMGLWWLTGTPCPKAPTDAWAQVRLVNPAKVPQFFGQFRVMTMAEVGDKVWKPKKGHQDTVFAAMQPAIRFAKKDCLDLPPMLAVDRPCALSAPQQVAFQQMATAMTVADQAVRASGGTVTAKNKADRINKLRQIMLGSVKTSADTYVTYDFTPRFDQLLEAIDESAAKVVVIVPFKGIIHELEKRLAKYYSIGMINGDVSASRRNKIIAEFKGSQDPHILLCHPLVMSHGLNLTEADTIVFFGPIYSNDDYRQVIERINRPPQTRKMTVVKISCNEIERAIYRSLDSDENQQQLILNLYKSVVGETHGP